MNDQVTGRSDGGESHRCDEIRFSISAEMVASFAALTGDQSSLHTSSDFGRRSMYRERVVHGMLPIMFLCALQRVGRQETVQCFTRISARFLKPVFVGDSLRLSAEVVSIDEDSGEVEVFFRIEKQPEEVEVTTGVVGLQFMQSDIAGDTVPSEESPSAPMIERVLPENNLNFSDISVGDADAFDFVIRPEHLRELRRIILSGLEGCSAAGSRSVTVDGDPQGLLAMSLFSTFVGMCRPGRSATFLDFSVRFEERIGLDRRYRFASTVQFLSQSTRTLVESVTIEDGERRAAVGKMKIRVNDPPRRMPSVGELRETGLDLRLRDKIVLVTGASRGIGETTAKLFSLHGATVAVNFLSGEEDANTVVSEIVNGGGVAKAFRADVAGQDQVHQMVEAIQKEFGGIDILIHNAVRNATPIEFLDLTWTEIQRDIDVTLQGAFHCCQAVIPGMIGRGGGKIVNIGTLYTENPPVGQLKYCVTKSALLGLTRSLAVEFAQHNIQVNMVTPSMVETDLSAGVPTMITSAIRSETPMQRLATALDVARAVIFLASSQASFTTGQRVMVTGGLPPFL